MRPLYTRKYERLRLIAMVVLAVHYLNPGVLDLVYTSINPPR
jgi:hypothetical protein